MVRAAAAASSSSSASPPPRRPTNFGTGSYEDDGDYDTVEEEIEALGGDPIFLDSEPDDADEQEKDTDPDFEWDGTVDEDAHLD